MINMCVPWPQTPNLMQNLHQDLYGYIVIYKMIAHKQTHKLTLISLYM